MAELISTVLTINPKEVSSVTFNLILQLLERDAKGKKKYGTSLDRKDLTKNQWLDHMTEELLDAAGYAQCSKDKDE